MTTTARVILCNIMGYDGATLYLVEGRYYERGCIKYLYTGDEEMRESANVCLIYTTKEVLFLKLENCSFSSKNPFLERLPKRNEIY